MGQTAYHKKLKIGKGITQTLNLKPLWLDRNQKNGYKAIAKN